MANLSQSPFLQALGWATLNSFWQMALLWCLYAALNAAFRFAPARRYQFSVGAILIGFGWFLLSFFQVYGQQPEETGLSFLTTAISAPNSLLNQCLVAASLAYLALLIFPVLRLYRNWQFVQLIQKRSVRKAELEYRLFVQRISAHLGISRKVQVLVSDLVRSPLTVGYLKPVILLPVAALNNLSAQQVEAILLHELSHIRRYDYLVNFVISIVHTLLYFNPFVRLFLRNIEDEREHCCDALVLQFGYDKLAYATALLTLEKLTTRAQVLAMAAAGKKRLLTRIEKITGMEKKETFGRRQLAGILAALLCIVALNSLLLFQEEKKAAGALAYDSLLLPLQWENGGERIEGQTPVNRQPVSLLAKAATPAPNPTESPVTYQIFELVPQPEALEGGQPEAVNTLIPVNYDVVDGSLTSEQKQKVKSTVDATRKIIGNMQWEVIDQKLADVLTQAEKEKAKAQYLQILAEKVNWQNVEQNIKAQYEQMDWTTIDDKIDLAMANLQMDSLQKRYQSALVELTRARKEAQAKSRVAISPLPDQSVEEMKRYSEEMRKRVDSIKSIRQPKKVIRL